MERIAANIWNPHKSNLIYFQMETKQTKTHYFYPFWGNWKLVFSGEKVFLRSRPKHFSGGENPCNLSSKAMEGRRINSWNANLCVSSCAQAQACRGHRKPSGVFCVPLILSTLFSSDGLSEPGFPVQPGPLTSKLLGSTCLCFLALGI